MDIHINFAAVEDNLADVVVLHTPVDFVEVHTPVDFVEVHTPVDFVEVHTPVDFVEVHTLAVIETWDNLAKVGREDIPAVTVDTLVDFLRFEA